MKKTISFILSALIALSIIAATPVTVAADDDVDAGKIGNKIGNLYWSIDEKGVLTISGKGDMLDFDEETQHPWGSISSMHFRTVRSVIISEGVTSIGDNAFSWCRELKSITIPDTVTRIGRLAFSHCENLPSITLPDSVTSIGDMAFSNCDYLSITIPAGVTSINNAAFAGSNELVLTVDPDSQYFYTDDSGALIDKKNSELLYYPMNNRETHYTIPKGIMSIGNWAISYNSSLESITMPDSVTSIGNRAFFGCHSLKSITMSDSLTSIGKQAFYCRSLKSITIPSSVTNICDWDVKDDLILHLMNPFFEGVTTIYVVPDSYGEKWAKTAKKCGRFDAAEIKTFSDKLTITSAKSSSAGIIECSWADIGADTYMVYIAEGDSTNYKRCGKFSGTSAKLDKFGKGDKAAKLESGKTYKLRVVRSDYTGKLSEALSKCPSVTVTVK